MDLKELQERQSWPLEQKIDHSLLVIENYLANTHKAYVSFSGGKDSTVLLDLVRRVDKFVPAVFVNTGNEYPEIIKFVRHINNDLNHTVIELRPELTPREVWAQYGFPLISKEQAEYIHRFRINPQKSMEKQLASEKNGWKYGKVSDRWKFLIWEDFEVSNECCKILKKNPIHQYQKETGRDPILGTMASESQMRTAEYLKRGSCNTFEVKKGIGVRSTPLAIWTDEDIWKYIERYKLEIADIYRKGARRTGCVGCGFGCQFSDDSRFETLYKLYPKYYEMIMNYQNSGVSYREALRMVLKKVGKKLPDEL